MRTFHDHGGLIKKIDERRFTEFRTRRGAILFAAGCAALGLLIPFCGVLCFTNWLDPLFH